MKSFYPKMGYKKLNSIILLVYTMSDCKYDITMVLGLYDQMGNNVVEEYWKKKKEVINTASSKLLQLYYVRYRDKEKNEKNKQIIVDQYIKMKRRLNFEKHRMIKRKFGSNISSNIIPYCCKQFPIPMFNTWFQNYRFNHNATYYTLTVHERLTTKYLALHQKMGQKLPVKCLHKEIKQKEGVLYFGNDILKDYDFWEEIKTEKRFKYKYLL